MRCSMINWLTRFYFLVLLLIVIACNVWPYVEEELRESYNWSYRYDDIIENMIPNNTYPELGVKEPIRTAVLTNIIIIMIIGKHSVEIPDIREEVKVSVYLLL